MSGRILDLVLLGEDGGWSSFLGDIWETGFGYGKFETFIKYRNGVIE